MKTFLKDTFFPFWLKYGVDELGGFQERLKSDLTPYREENKKRVLVQFRQAFVFARAYQLTKDTSYADAAKRGLQFAFDSYWDNDKGGFLHAHDIHLKPLISNRNLYDHAFALFSMAHVYDVFKNEEGEDQLDILSWISKVSKYINDNFKCERGFYEYLDANNIPLTNPREQNPHMHLLEGYLALYEFVGDQTYLDKASELVALFCSYMQEPKLGGVVEFFSSDWTSYDEKLGDKVEPGHCFEWAWLLMEFSRLSNRSDVIEAAKKAYDFGVSFGYDQSFGGYFNEVNRLGVVSNEKKRIWPETEAIKAHISMYKSTGDKSYKEMAQRDLDFLMKNRLNENGSWKEHLSRELEDLTDVHPSTTAYHLLMAFLEFEKNS